MHIYVDIYIYLVIYIYRYITYVNMCVCACAQHTYYDDTDLHDKYIEETDFVIIRCIISGSRCLFDLNFKIVSGSK